MPVLPVGLQEIEGSRLRALLVCQIAVEAVHSAGRDLSNFEHDVVPHGAELRLASPQYLLAAVVKGQPFQANCLRSNALGVLLTSRMSWTASQTLCGFLRAKRSVKIRETSYTGNLSAAAPLEAHGGRLRAASPRCRGFSEKRNTCLRTLGVDCGSYQINDLRECQQRGHSGNARVNILIYDGSADHGATAVRLDAVQKIPE